MTCFFYLCSWLLEDHRLRPGSSKQPLKSGWNPQSCCILCILSETECLSKINGTRFKEHLITKIFLSGEIYGSVATHHLLVSHCAKTHSTYTPVDDVSKGTEDFSVIQFVTNVTVCRIFISSAFIELLVIFCFIVVRSCLNPLKFIHLNLLNAANKLSRSACHRLQAVVRVTAGPRFLLCAKQIMVLYFFIPPRY